MTSKVDYNRHSGLGIRHIKRFTRLRFRLPLTLLHRFSLDTLRSIYTVLYCTPLQQAHSESMGSTLGLRALLRFGSLPSSSSPLNELGT
jgi:hypothetical protein